MKVCIDATEAGAAHGAMTTWYAGYFDVRIDDGVTIRCNIDGETDRGSNTPEDQLIQLLCDKVDWEFDDKDEDASFDIFMPFAQLAIEYGGKLTYEVTISKDLADDWHPFGIEWKLHHTDEKINEIENLGKMIARAHGVVDFIDFRPGQPSSRNDESMVFKVLGKDLNGEEINAEFAVHWRDL